MEAHVEHFEDHVSYDNTEETLYPNRWSRYRHVMIREPCAEFLGVAILILFGNGVDCQVVLSSNPGVTASPKGDYLSLNFGWAVGTAMGVWVSGGISGGHINPAVTLALATYRGFPWRKVPGYIFAQLLGGIVGAALIYANYFHALDIFEGGPGVRTLKTANLFSTYALDYMTNVSCFFSEFLAAAILMVVVLAMNDKKNCPPPAGLAPLILFILILGIGASLGMETGYAINPARDLGPRMLTAMVGYGKEVFTFRNHYWLWCPILGPILGTQAGTIFYDAFLFTGEESIFNKPNARARQQHIHAHAQERKPAPGGPGADEAV
ncbi:aquaporin-like protein [Crucibulum laeve]|uniref:Aquaporin-like protein n=1 Tax=Crucibulum laeve TaxID=68775 RepID=A0A5C3M6A9_9AGAR|nr:aquaporin-like protein [Crucibulum laeve]